MEVKIKAKVKRKINNQSGAAMLVAVIFFLFISLAIISGLFSPTVREFRNASVNLSSKKSYFLAESGSEDALYRLLNNMTIGVNETLTLDSNTATTTITDGGLGSKSITSLGDVSSYQRKVALSLGEGDGISFSYGIQAGEWGFRMGDKSFIDGSIYSNGPVIGTGTADVTGTVTSANTPALVADQQNGSGTPTYNLAFARHDSHDAAEDIAQSFVVSATGVLNKAEVYMKKVGHPANVTVYITHDIGGEPDDVRDILAQGVLSASLVSTNYGWVTVTFETNPNLISGQTYWLVIESNNDDHDYYIAGANTSYANGSALIGTYSHDHHHHEGSWDPVSPSNADLFFKIYLNGLLGSIDNVNIGKNGTANAYAHNVIDSSITGINYCQTGSGNNKSCNTSLPDPVSIAMPISEQNIQDWKDDALTGGVIEGDYIPGGHGVTLGPKKINGNFHLDDKDILTLTGTIWVTGNLRVDHRAIVEPSASYSGSSVAVIVDGTITIQNDAEFTSGDSRSYVLALSTSNCPFDPSCAGNDAITLSSKVDAVILYAANGLIDVRSRAKAKQVTGYGIDLGNDSDLIYDKGLINQNFIGGPSGAWKVKSWGESQ
ncbi:MAG: choice-of-anchor R domain-containing protein [bacterium]